MEGTPALDTLLLDKLASLVLNVLGLPGVLASVGAVDVLGVPGVHKWCTTRCAPRPHPTSTKRCGAEVGEEEERWERAVVTSEASAAEKGCRQQEQGNAVRNSTEEQYKWAVLGNRRERQTKRWGSPFD